MAQQPDGHVTGFVEGNMERWSYIIASYLPQAWSTVIKTVDPLVYSALIELLGSNTRFTKKAASIVPAFGEDKTIVALTVYMQYKVPDFIGYSGDQNAVEQDRQYILQKAQQAGNVKWTQQSVVIDPQQGLVTVTFQIKVGP